MCIICIDQKNGVGIETGSLVGTVNLVIVVNEGETMIVGAEIVIGIMIEIVDMIATVTETQTAPAPMTQEVVGGHALDPESDLEIMIDIGTDFLDHPWILFFLSFFNMLV